MIYQFGYSSKYSVRLRLLNTAFLVSFVTTRYIDPMDTASLLYTTYTLLLVDDIVLLRKHKAIHLSHHIY